MKETSQMMSARAFVFEQPIETFVGFKLIPKANSIGRPIVTVEKPGIIRICGLGDQTMDVDKINRSVIGRTCCSIKQSLLSGRRPLSEYTYFGSNAILGKPKKTIRMVLVHTFLPQPNGDLVIKLMPAESQCHWVKRIDVKDKVRRQDFPNKRSWRQARNDYVARLEKTGWVKDKDAQVFTRSILMTDNQRNLAVCALSAYYAYQLQAQLGAAAATAAARCQSVDYLLPVEAAII